MTDRPAPLVRIINPSTRWARIGEYECGVEYEVPADVADALAPRGFIYADTLDTLAAPITPTATPEE